MGWPCCLNARQPTARTAAVWTTVSEQAFSCKESLKGLGAGINVNALECFLWTVPPSEGKSSHRGPEQMRHAQANMVESRLKKIRAKGCSWKKKILHSQKAKKKRKKNNARFSDSLSVKGYI